MKMSPALLKSAQVKFWTFPDAASTFFRIVHLLQIQPDSRRMIFPQLWYHDLASVGPIRQTLSSNRGEYFNDMPPVPMCLKKSGTRRSQP